MCSLGEIRMLMGVVMMATFCAVVGSGCLKDSNDGDSGEAVPTVEGVAPTNGVADETADMPVEPEEPDVVVEDPDAAKVYVAIGDCLTLGGVHPGPSYVEMLEGMMGVDIINEGRDSEGSKSAAARLPSVLSRHNPDYLLILLGSMDATGRWEIESFYTYYDQMVRMALAADCTPLLATFPPQMTTELELQRSIQLNAEIRRVAARYHIPLVDIEDAFDFRESLYQEDLWHQNSAGSRVVAEEFYRVLRGL